MMTVCLLLTFLLGAIVAGGAKSSREHYAGGSGGIQCLDTCNAAGSPPELLVEFQQRQSAPRDWDYLLLEQLFVPQYCRLLEEGVDVTLSHQRVLPYPEGTQCIADRVTNSLTVHGLWPNYFHGYPTCCSGADVGGPPNVPLNPREYEAAFPAEHPLSPQSMDQLRLDPAVPTAYASLCNLGNHEWQKHGYCLGYWPDGGAALSSSTWNVTHLSAQYFNVTFLVAAEVASATAAIDGWAAVGHSPTASQIRQLYPRRIELLCARSEGGSPMRNRLLAIRTCWDMSKNSWGPPAAKDCFPEQPYAFFAICDHSRPVMLDKYEHPTGWQGVDSRKSKPSSVSSLPTV